MVNQRKGRVRKGNLGFPTLPSYEFRTSGESEEKPKQSDLEKKKIRKPDTQKQPSFFYASNI